MPIIKIISIINWILIASWGSYMVYALLAPKTASDAAGRGQETTLIGLGIFILLLLSVLNILPYNWARIVGLITGLLMVLLMWQMIYN